MGHIVAVHVKDTKPGVFKNVPFGEGVVDFERCFETLKTEWLLRAVPD